MTPDFLLEAPVEDLAESTPDFLTEASLGQAVEISVTSLRETPAERPEELLREEPEEEQSEHPAQEPAQRPEREPEEQLLGFFVEPPFESPAAPWDMRPPWQQAECPVLEPLAGHADVAIVGLGQGGLSCALAFRRAGLRVLGIDTSTSRLNDIRGGRFAVAGIGQEELREQLRDEDLAFVSEIELVGSADAVLIFVSAILDAQRHPSYEALKRACAAVVEHARVGQTIVLTSAGYVGCTRELLAEPLAERGLRVGEDVFLAFSAERDRSAASGEIGAPGDQQAPRVVGAASESCYGHAAELLGGLCERLHRVSSPEAAEMVKLYESSSRAVNIALAFEIADACRTAQLDPSEITAAAASGQAGFVAHPSAGVGGHSAGVEPYCLLHPLRERGRPALLMEEAMRAVAARPRRVAMRAHELLLRSGQRLRDARVLVVGAAYKPGAAETSGSPAVEIISWLAAEGVQVSYHDPLVPVLHVDDEDMYSTDPDPRRDASGFGPEDYDLAIVVTIQPGHDYGWLRRCQQVLDCTYSEPTGRRCLLP